MDLGKKLREALAKLSGKPYVDESAVRELIKDLQRILISSDVNVKLVFELSKRIEQKALETEKKRALSLKEHVLKVVYDELIALMGAGYSPRMDKHRILLCGLFGSGKTTTTAKIAYFYKSKGLSVGVVGADVERPAAQEQLEQLAKKINANFYTIKGEKNAVKVVEDALQRSKDDILVVDSAGRSAFDNVLREELSRINTALKPDETYLVVSGDIGQVAGKHAEEFAKVVNLTGVIATKMDGSGKGGGALSSVGVVGTKIAFIGVGEKPEDFEVYNSEKFVGRLLGVPDIAGLLEKAKKISEEEDLKKLETEEFTIEAFYNQLKAAKKLGPLSSVFSMLGAPDIPQEFVQQSESKLKKFEAMINSMTKAERKDAALIRRSHSRIERIAKGAGCSTKDVSEFLSQFEKMEKLLNKFKHDRGFRKKIEQFMKSGNLGGVGSFKLN